MQDVHAVAADEVHVEQFEEHCSHLFELLYQPIGHEAWQTLPYKTVEPIRHDVHVELEPEHVAQFASHEVHTPEALY
jgi:hypothetical protein